jgi:DNA repair protein RecO (recombination protein O)
VPAQPDQCIVLRQWDYSETSQTVSLFGRGLGVVRGLAKGSRRPKSAYSGGFEALTLGQAMLIQRPSGELALITEWDLQEVFWGPRRDLRSHYAGLYMVDLIHHMVSDHDPHPVLWDALAGALRSLEGEGAWAHGVLTLQWTLLSECGYRPSLDSDVSTSGGKAPRAYGFDPARGGVVADPGRSTKGAWRVRPETIRLLRDLDSIGTSRAGDHATIERASRLLSLYLRSIIGRELGSREAVFRDGAV